jgi:hypothetical protein
MFRVHVQAGARMRWGFWFLGWWRVFDFVFGFFILFLLVFFCWWFICVVFFLFYLGVGLFLFSYWSVGGTLRCLPVALAFPCFLIGLFASPLCGAAPTFLCRRKEK